MQGIIELKSGTYIFRDDHGHDNTYWAWEVHDDYDRSMVHKWEKLPKGIVTLFDVDNPPPTVPYQPLLN